MNLTPELCHAARILARVDHATLSSESGLTEDRIAAFENGKGELGESMLEKLKAALEGLGIVFLPEESEGGVGIRLKFTDNEARRINKWEGEGGRVDDDDAV